MTKEKTDQEQLEVSYKTLFTKVKTLIKKGELPSQIKDGIQIENLKFKRYDGSHGDEYYLHLGAYTVNTKEKNIEIIYRYLENLESDTKIKHYFNIK